MLPAQIAQAAALPPGGALTSWSLEPLPTIGIVIAGALYVEGLRSLRLRGGPPFNRWRATCYLGGLVVLFLALASPIEAARRARAIVQATTHFDDPKVLLEVSQDLVGAMKGLAVAAMTEAEMLQKRGW